MKFYFVYEQAFPWGFGLAAAICICLGLYGLILRRPFVYPFFVTMLVYVGALVPLFMLSLNHYWQAWPLDLGTAALNGFGMLGTTAILVALLIARFDLSVVGAGKAAVMEAVRAKFPQLDSSAVKVFQLFFGSICYVRINSEESDKAVRTALRDYFQEHPAGPRYLGAVACLLLGALCLVTASISWCVSTQCVQRFS